jgi:DNA replication regulator DPB11
MLNGKGNSTTVSTGKVLQGTVLCCVCVDKSIQSKVVGCGNQLGAVWKPVVTKDMTALIVDRAGGSDQYLQAISLKVPVIKHFWMYECFKEKKYIHWKNEHFVPSFWGYTIVVTGLSGSKRQEIMDLVNKNGGKYRDTLIRDETTHLISNTTCSEKYDAARDWGWDTIKVVNENWIYDCVKESSKRISSYLSIVI